MSEILDCPICTFNSAYIFTSKLNKRIFKCKNQACGHFFTPSLDKYQGICERLQDIEKESDQFTKVFGERNERLLGFFINALQRTEAPSIFLDFGAGNAHISRTFKGILKDKVKIYCIEPNTLCNDLYAKYDLIRLDSPNDVREKIDLIYLTEVIEHLENPIEVLNSLKHLLSANGLIFISTPAGSKYEFLTNAFETPSHVHFFTPKSLNLALRKAGLLKIKFRYYDEMYPRPNNKNIISTFFHKIKFLAKGALYKIGAPDLYNGHLVGFTKSANSHKRLDS